MKILVIARGYPSPSNPQWGCFEKDQAIALQKLGHTISYMSVERGLNTYRGGFKITNKKTSDINVYNSRCFILEKLIESISLSIAIKYYEKQFLKLFEYYISKESLPDIIFVHYLGNMEYLRLIKEKYNIPIVGMEHWSRINTTSISTKLYEKGKLAYSNVDKIIAVSQTLNHKIKKKWNKDSIVINNMVGSEFCYIKRKKKEFFQFVSCGRLLSGKGFDVLIKAFSKSDLKEKNVRVVIIGEGRERNKLQNLINDLKLDKQILLLGQKEKYEILKIYSDSDAFVLSSRGETFGVVYIEAMMTGLPVIGTKCGGPEEIINNKNGIILNVDDVEALKNALETMYNNINQFDRQQISIDCMNKYSSERIAKQLIDIFTEVIDERRLQ